jgi:hypothetical protein
MLKPDVKQRLAGLPGQLVLFEDKTVWVQLPSLAPTEVMLPP